MRQKNVNRFIISNQADTFEICADRVEEAADGTLRAFLDDRQVAAFSSWLAWIDCASYSTQLPNEFPAPRRTSRNVH